MAAGDTCYVQSNGRYCTACQNRASDFFGNVFVPGVRSDLYLLLPGDRSKDLRLVENALALIFFNYLAFQTKESSVPDYHNGISS